MTKCQHCDADILSTSQPTASELAPCPFCGASDAFAEREDFTSAYVTCNHCSARGPVECQESDDEETPGKSSAEISWNTRLSRTSQPNRMGTTPEMQKMYDEFGEKARYRHKKRGSVYRVLHEGTMSTSEVPRMDDEPMVVYQCEADGKIWVRPIAEFYDGRFEELPRAALAATPAVVRCDRCGSSGDVFMMCAGCQEPLKRVATPAVGGEPVAWRYQRKEGWGNIWRYYTEMSFSFEAPDDWTVQPLYAAQPASPLRGRDAVIEECAKACEARITGTDGLPGGNDYGNYASYNCEDLACAKAVRALLSASAGTARHESSKP